MKKACRSVAKNKTEINDNALMLSGHDAILPILLEPTPINNEKRFSPFKESKAENNDLTPVETHA